MSKRGQFEVNWETWLKILLIVLAFVLIIIYVIMPLVGKLTT
jgi:flagellar biogenesis protein FliO